MKQWIASFDIETTNLQADFGIVLCAVIKPWGEPFETYRIDAKRRGVVSSDDSKVVGDIINRLNQFSVLVAHNGVSFDRPFLNTRALSHGLPQLVHPHGMFVDPVKVARKHLRLNWNGLDKVAAMLNTKHHKTPIVGDTWLRASLDRDRTALDSVVAHCIADVLVLEEVADRLKPFIKQIHAYGSA